MNRRVHQIDGARLGWMIRWGIAICGARCVWVVPNILRDISKKNACKRCLKMKRSEPETQLKKETT